MPTQRTRENVTVPKPFGRLRSSYAQSLVRRASPAGSATQWPGRLWVRTFDTIEEPRQALLALKDLNNSQWILEGHGYRTPSQVRHGLKESRIAEAAG